MSSETPRNPDETSAVRRTPARKRKIPFVPQLTPNDCGVACLSSALSFHGKHVPINELRGALGSGRNGVTAKRLLQVARTYGLRAQGVKVEPDTLQFLPRGSILHWDLSHFVVFEQLRGAKLSIVDPAAGRRTLLLAEAEKSLSGVALVLEPGADFVPVLPSRSPRFARYVRWIFGVRDIWSRLLWTSLALQLLALALPGVMGVLVDKVVPRGDTDLLNLISAGFLSVSSFFFLSTFLRARLLLQLRTQVEARMSLEFVEHLLALPYSFFQQRSTGDMMMRMSSQAQIRELLTTGALSALLDGTLVIVYCALLAMGAPKLALIAFAVACLQAAICVFASRRNAAMMAENLTVQARLESYQVEMLAGMETLKCMGVEERVSERWARLYVNVLNRALERGELGVLFQSVVGVLRFGGPLLLMLAGAYSVLDGSLSLGAMLSLSALGAGFLEPVTKLVGTAMQLSELTSYMARIEDVLDSPPEPACADGVSTELAGGICAQGLCFRYPGEVRRVLESVDLDVWPGQCVAIVGASASGKSTLARLFSGLYRPESGSLLFDDVEFSRWNLSSLRARLGIVSQDTKLFSGTIRDNITLFDEGVHLDDVKSAAELACLHEEICAMPMGYDTVLADGGSSLSGGQRQRLALARALVRHPRVLVLDEATSALDTVTEGRVQAKLRALRCTRIVIAHRLSTVIEADKIVVLDAGRIVAVGRHAELLVSCGAYQNLVQAQGGAGMSGLLAVAVTGAR